MATIKEDYVSFETAKILKEKGFDESISMVYMSYGDLCKLHRYDSICNSNYNDITKNYFECTAPTLQMAMKWLREVHNVFIEPKMSKNTFLWGYRVSISNGRTRCIHANIFNKYEEACEAAIKYCLENLI